jgi:hypothetical protein
MHGIENLKIKKCNYLLGWLVIELANPCVKILSLSEGTSIITLCNTVALFSQAPVSAFTTEYGF